MSSKQFEDQLYQLQNDVLPIYQAIDKFYEDLKTLISDVKAELGDEKGDSFLLNIDIDPKIDENDIIKSMEIMGEILSDWDGLEIPALVEKYNKVSGAKSRYKAEGDYEVTPEELVQLFKGRVNDYFYKIDIAIQDLVEEAKTGDFESVFSMVENVKKVVDAWSELDQWLYFQTKDIESENLADFVDGLKASFMQMAEVTDNFVNSISEEDTDFSAMVSEFENKLNEERPEGSESLANEFSDLLDRAL